MLAAGATLLGLCGFARTAASAADLPVNGVTIGTSVAALAQTLGAPAGVSSGDSGNRFDFRGGIAAYTDDDGIVLAADARSGSPRIDVDGVVRAFTVGSYSGTRADAELAAVAEFATNTLRSYRLAPRRDLVLAFTASSNRLERVAYGEPGQLARLGLLPGDGAAKAVDYHAPRLRGIGLDTSAGPRTTVLRAAVDRSGSVTGVDIVIASTDAAADAALARRLRGEHYAPATLDGRPIAATTFVEVHH